MNGRPRWDRCVSHRGGAAEGFFREYFSLSDRAPLLIAGAGFDPRASDLAQLLADAADGRVSACFLREQRPAPDEDLLTLANENESRMRECIPNARVEHFDIFEVDDAPVGGRRAVALLNKILSLDGVTDIVLDCSALSVGVFYPLAKYCYKRVCSSKQTINLHLVVLDNPRTDAAIEAVPCGRASYIHAFTGGLNLESNADAARLWLPQLGHGKREVLELIHKHVDPHAVCPILPFPATDPRAPDRLIEEYGELFETIRDPFAITWHVDARDLVYAHEKGPLDLYRTILRIDEARRPVFDETGGSRTILSPLGTKAVALGMLMAALEKDFAVVSVESIDYRAAPDVLASDGRNGGEFVHIWLYGEAYQAFHDTEVSSI